MTFLPIVGRELCAESRRPFNYWLRVLGAGALTIVAALTFLPRTSPGAWTAFGFGSGPSGQIQGQNPFGELGMILFGNLNATVFVALWVLVPLLTADCINREKRDGTLGLLFLTPLTSTGIVVGKSLAHSLRALTLYFTMLPVLVMPLMLGGVTVQDGLMAALLDFGALMLALAAGLLASAWTRDWLKSVALAQLLSALFVFIFMAMQQRALERAVAGAAPIATAAGAGVATFTAAGGFIYFRSPAWHGGEAGFLSQLRVLFAHVTNLPSEGRHLWNAATGMVIVQSTTAWSEVWGGFPPSVHGTWFRRAGLIVFGCLAVLVASVIVAGRSIERSWRETPPSAGRQRMNAAFTQPVVGRTLLRRKLKRALERNPIGWLQQYSWHARLTKWGWCAFVVCIELLFASSWQDAWDVQWWIALFLLLGLAFSAAGSFRRERETGALELLLVTPLRASQIIRGRLQGIRMQYLPSIATLLLAWICLMQPNWMRSLFTPDLWESGFVKWLHLLAAVTVSYVTLPVIGLYFSLRRMNHLVSWLCACAIGLLLPWLLFGRFDFILGLLLSLGVKLELLLPLRGENLVSLTAALSWQLAAALTASVLLRLNLTRRHFVTN